MNRKVLATMLWLTVAFLFVIYFVKFLFPDWIVGVAASPGIVAIGEFVDARWWLDILVGIGFFFLTYWLYMGAVLRKITLNYRVILAICVACAFSMIFAYLAPAYALWANIMPMIMLPTIFRADMRNFALVCGIHFTAQVFTLQIRNIAVLTPSSNFATLLILAIDVYIWLGLLFAFQNYKRKEK